MPIPRLSFPALVLLALLPMSALAASSSQISHASRKIVLADNATAFQAYDNYEGNGPDFGKINSSDVQACASACQTQAACQGYSYDKRVNLCTLKSSVTMLRFDPRFVVGLHSGAALPPTSELPTEMSLRPGISFSGGEYRSEGQQTMDACQAKCESDKDCVGFTYAKTEAVCHLISTIADERETTDSDSGEKRQQAPSAPQASVPAAEQPPAAVAAEPTAPAPGNYRYRVNRDIYGHDIIQSDGLVYLVSTDIDDCTRKCDQAASCVAISFDRWNNRCYLKSEVSSSMLDVRSSIAVKQPNDIPDVSEAVATIEPLHRRRLRGENLSTKVASSLPQCRTSCEQDLHCVGFNFSKAGSGSPSCEMFRRLDGRDVDNAVESGYKTQAP
jgi:hypothetical protein